MATSATDLQQLPQSSDFQPAGIGDERIILDFEHLPGGQNCLVSSLQRLLHHYGHRISEAMLFGVASGLGFIYWKQKCMPAPFVGGMNAGKFPSIVGRAIQRLGGQYRVLKSRAVDRAHRHLKDTLREGQPAMVIADMAYLNHLSVGEDDHFGQHMFLVYGIDEPADRAYLSDRFANTVTMPLTELQRARASEWHPFPARNKMLRFSVPVRLTPLESIIPAALKENLDFMLEPPISNFGLKGILKWRRLLGRYPEMIPDPEQLVIALRDHYIYIEISGTGGALFRRMYSDFLREAGELLGDSALAAASQEYTEIAEIWTGIGNALLPDHLPNLRLIRELHWKNNRDLEQGHSAAVEKARRRLSRQPELVRRAAKEDIKEFPAVLEEVSTLLKQVHAMESGALRRLAASETVNLSP